MPELPEVETLVRQLRLVIIGKKINKVEVLRSKSFQGTPDVVIGRKITGIDRIGKMMIISFEKEFPKLLIHLKMTGQLIYQEYRTQNLELSPKRIVGGHPTADWVSELPSKHTRVIITFTDRSTLYFNDQRVFGWLKLVASEEELRKEKRGFVGLDPLLSSFKGKFLQQVFKNSKKPIKTAILEQHKIAGLGNIYANDALFLAGIHPLTLTNKLEINEWNILAKAVQQVLLRGIETGGASQTNYVHLDGLGGSYQKEFLVYKQDKSKCNKCGSVIAKIKLGCRGTFFCPGCQK